MKSAGVACNGLGVKRYQVFALACFAVASAARGADWPNWRGPTDDGISTETGWSTPLSAEGPKRLWKASVGLGISSIAVRQGRAYTMGHEADRDTVFCLDAVSGRILWRHSYPCPC